MLDHPIQVTCYCSESDLKSWKEFLERKGYDTVTKTRKERYHKGFINRYALFRALTSEELAEIKDGKYKLVGTGLINLERMSVKLGDGIKPKKKESAHA